MEANTNPKLRKNGGKGTFFGNLLRGIIDVGKSVSPHLKALLDNFDPKQDDIVDIASQLAKEGFDDNELTFLLTQLDLDKSEQKQITKRWQADMSSDSWLAKNVRPATLVLYNIAVIVFIALDSYVPEFNVKDMWLNVLISNTGIINTAYFGSKYLEKKDKIKYKYK